MVLYSDKGGKGGEEVVGWVGGVYTRRAYIRDVNWVTYLGSVYSSWSLYTRSHINGILRYMKFIMTLAESFKGILMPT